jgi:hypothetical protein
MSLPSKLMENFMMYNDHFKEKKIYKMKRESKIHDPPNVIRIFLFMISLSYLYLPIYFKWAYRVTNRKSLVTS